MKKTEHKSTVLLTGATGLVGSYLLGILLKNGHKVFALARGKKNNKAGSRVAAALNFWNVCLYRAHKKDLHIIEGDITDKNLGLPKSILTELRKETDLIFHCAAATNLNTPFNHIKRINVTGTKNLLNFAFTCSHLNQFNHISTAYVCGNYAETFSENDFDVKQNFNSSYEQSKFEAEKILRENYNSNFSINIYRPPIVVSETRTGKIINFRNIYQIISLCKLNLIDTLPLLNAHIHLAPVDRLCEDIYALSTHAKEFNQTYHPFSHKPVLLSTIINNAAKKMSFPKPRFTSINKIPWEKVSPAQRIILNKLATLINFSAKFNNNKTHHLLKNHGYS